MEHQYMLKIFHALCKNSLLHPSRKQKDCIDILKNLKKMYSAEEKLKHILLTENVLHWF